jgi:hypothetical protein
MIALECFQQYPGCSNVDFEDCVLQKIFAKELSKKPSGLPINLKETFEKCFGLQKPNGDFIDCSTSGSSTFQLTLFAQQPIPGSRSPYAGDPISGIDVGHTFISLVQNNGGVEHRVAFGFYPSSVVNNENKEAPMVIIDDSGHTYSSSVTISLNCNQFNSALNNALSESNLKYHIETYNCTDYGIQVSNSVGLGVNDTTSPWIYSGKTYGNLSNPGDLGEDIKLTPGGSINSTGGKSPFTKCE